MVLEEDGEGSRTLPLHPDVPEQPNGLALDVEKGDALGSMFIRQMGFALEDTKAGTLELRVPIIRMSLTQPQDVGGQFRVPNR
jgi:hypothetical protein